MDIKLVKELGKGIMGTVYLIESGKQKYIYKIEKYKPEKYYLLHPYYRQIDFDEKVAQKHPDKFMTLKSYGILNKCEHNQTIPKWVKGETREYLVTRNREKSCFFLIYCPVLKETWQDAAERIFANKKLYINALYKLIEQVNIMHLAGFSHNDLHSKNIMISGADVRIIDYGNISHKKYPKNARDIINSKNKVMTDIIYLLRDILIDNPALSYIFENKVKASPFKVFLSELDKHPHASEICSFIPRHAGIARNELKALLFSVFDYKFYTACLGIPGKKKFSAVIPDRDLIVLCIQHCMDKDLTPLLRKIKLNNTTLLIND